MTSKEIQESILFCLDNNRDSFITSLVSILPAIQLTPFWSDYQGLSNEELSRKITLYLIQSKNLYKLRNLKFVYKSDVQNYTTEQNNIEQFTTKTVEELNNTRTSFWGVLGGESVTQPSSTTKTETKTNAVLVIGVLISLISLVFVIFKFYK